MICSRMVYKDLTLGGALVDIVTEEGIITHIGKTDERGISFVGKEVFPGLLDIHTHGMGGVDTMDADLPSLARLYAKSGTTAFYPTTMTASLKDLSRVLSAPLPSGGARIMGFHLEGPYLAPEAIGAQNKEFLRKADKKEFSPFPQAKIITLAPETEGALSFIDATDLTVCIGHTRADFDTTKEAIRRGAKCLSHTFNAMPPLHHREPSVIGAAFDENIYVQVICDGEHIHPTMIRMLYRLFGPKRMILISDSMRATSMPDGEYDLGGQKMTVKGGVARTPDGALAGSTATLFECAKRAISFGIPKEDAFRMASLTPAEMMHLPLGEIKVGAPCDLIILDENENLDTVIIRGEVISE